MTYRVPQKSTDTGLGPRGPGWGPFHKKKVEKKLGSNIEFYQIYQDRNTKNDFYKKTIIWRAKSPLFFSKILAEPKKGALIPPPFFLVRKKRVGGDLAYMKSTALNFSVFTILMVVYLSGCYYKRDQELGYM